MNCPKCASPVKPGQKFCSTCGASLAIRFCQVCRTPLGPASRFCPNCGADSQDMAPGTVPGAKQYSGQSAPPAPNPQFQTVPAAAAPAKPQRRGCLRCGCLAVWVPLAVFLLLLAVLAGVYYRVPERLGLAKSPAERLLQQQPDRYAAAMIAEDLEAAGFDTTGMYLYVLPIEGQTYKLAYVLMDASDGFRFESLGDRDALTEMLISVANSDAAQRHSVGRVAVDYRDATGNQMVTLTAPTEEIQAFARGEISRDAFLVSLEGTVDLQILSGGPQP